MINELSFTVQILTSTSNNLSTDVMTNEPTFDWALKYAIQLSLSPLISMFTVQAIVYSTDRDFVSPDFETPSFLTTGHVS